MSVQLRLFFRRLFTKHLLFTNTVTVSGLLALGDACTQRFERTYDSDEKTKRHDFKRTGRMLVLGLVLGPVNHGWYRILDKYVTGSKAKVVTQKILGDQLVAAPVFCMAYLAGLGLLEGKTIKDCVEELKQKFLFVYVVDWFVWPPAQFINFYFLPPHFRVAYVSAVTFCWNSFMSFIKHRKLKMPWLLPEGDGKE